MRQEHRKANGGAKAHLRLQLLACTLTSFLLGGLIPTALAQLHPGNILVIDRHAGADGRGLLFRVDPATSARTVISNFGDAAGLGLSAVAIDASGNILVLDRFGGPSDLGRLFSVNPNSGFRTVISNFGDDKQGASSNRNPIDVTVDVSNILVLEGGSRGLLLSVDSTGFRTVVSELGSATDLRSLAVDPSGNILVVDRLFGFTGEPLHGAVFKVDPNTGNQTILSWFKDPAQGTVGDGPESIAIDPSGNILVIGFESLTNHRVLFSINPNNGFRTILSDFSDPAQGPQGVFGVFPGDVAIDASRNIWVIDAEAGMNGRGALFSVNPATGFRTIVTDFGNRAQGERGVDPVGVAVVPTPVTQPVDLTIANMEITQGIQNFANNVPLVQDKTTYVRVYPRVDIADRRVGARLRGFREGAELPGSPLRPLYPFATAHTGGAARAVLNDSFNFWVPPAWRSGRVTFQAEINFGGAVPETNLANNVLSLTRDFIEKAPVCMTMVPVRTHGSLYTVDSPGFWSIIDRFKSLWPVPDPWVFFQSEPIAKLQARFGIPPWEFVPYDLPDNEDRINLALAVRDFFSTPPAVCPVGGPFRTVGMVSSDTNTGVRSGLGALGIGVSWVKMVADRAASSPFNEPPGGVYMAHELAHNFGVIGGGFNRWGHTNCPIGMPPALNPFYPYPPDELGPAGDSAFWGFDPITKAIIAPPKGARDLMSYCYPVWTSDYNWRGIFDEIGAPPTRSVRTPNVAIDLNPNAELLVVAGVITPRTNTATFEYAYRLGQEMLSPHMLEGLQLNQNPATNPAALYTLELVDAHGAVLFSLPFEPIRAADRVEGERTEHAFLLTVPFHPETARIRITQNGHELGALTVSAHAPQVNLLQPIGGETITDRLTIRWQASDQDNDPLLYTVQYSPDLGTSWQALVTQTPETILTVNDMRSLPGSNRRALVRVIATDGVNTGSHTSNPFTVESQAPVAHIDTPTNRAIFASNSQVILIGGARDAEEGSLGAEALTWFVDGELVGSGKETAVGGLEPGSHVITLRAVDNAEKTNTTSVTITIVDSMPVASADSYSTSKDTPLTVDAPGVLGNDIDPAETPLSAMQVSNVSHGTLTLKADGSFTYRPKTNFSGVDSFSYQANNGTANSNVVTVSLTVGEVTFLGVPVEIDIEPDEFPNLIHISHDPNRSEVTTVAILTTPTFDATTVDPTTVWFGKTGMEAAPIQTALADANGDGTLDLVLRFRTQDTGLQCGDTSAELTGQTGSGQDIQGSDSIVTVRGGVICP